MLDLVNPLAADRHPLGEGGKGRRDEGERGAQQHCRSPHRVYLIEPVTRPAASRKVVTPLALVRAVPVTRPARSWNVVTPLASVRALPVTRPARSWKRTSCASAGAWQAWSTVRW